MTCPRSLHSPRLFIEHEDEVEGFAAYQRNNKRAMKYESRQMTMERTEIYFQAVRVVRHGGTEQCNAKLIK